MALSMDSLIWSGRQAQALHDAIVNCRLHAPDFVVIRIGMCPIRIGEKHNKKLLLWIDPYGGPGESGMADALFGKVAATRRGLCGHIPA